MLLEVLHKTVGEYLSDESNKTKIITIKLPSFIYKTLQLEINNICRFITDVPIEGFTFSSLTFYKRAIHLESGDPIDSIFEKHLIEQMLILDAKVPKEDIRNEPIV